MLHMPAFMRQYLRQAPPHSFVLNTHLEAAPCNTADSNTLGISSERSQILINEE